MNFEITQELSVIMNNYQSSTKMRFNVEFMLHDKTEDKRVYVIKKDKLKTLSLDETSHSKITEELEWLTYPIKIETDYNGNFVKIVDHDKWLQQWQENSDKLIEGFENIDEAKDIQTKYYEFIKDEEKYVSIKFKEPFFNMLFFNPPLDNVNEPDLGTSLPWNIKSIGTLSCVGATKVLNRSSKESVILFESSQALSAEIVNVLKLKIANSTVSWEEQKAALQVASTFDSIERKMKSKRGTFKLFVEGAFSYTEETIINTRN